MGRLGAMRSKDEQIDAILRQRTWEWAHRQLPSGETIDDHPYEHFVSVTPDEVVAHVLAHGFDTRAVWTPGQPPQQKDGSLVVEPSGTRWLVYYTERLQRRDERAFDRYEDAARDAVMRLMDSAWIGLSHRYWHRHHPELPRLPDFGEPWPVRARGS